MTITELAGSFGIKSYPTQQLETAPLTLQLQIDTISRDLSSTPIIIGFLDGGQLCVP